MALTPVQEVKLNVGDLDPTMPFLDTESYEYFLTKNSNSVRRASLDAARAILMLLATRGSETVDIFSIQGGKSAEQYRLALQMYLKDPNLNPVYATAGIFAGGVSKADIQTNLSNSDNNTVVNPFDYSEDTNVKSSTGNPFEV